MSILIALRLTEDCGLFAADKAYSYRGRTVKHEKKIFKYGNFLLGFSGDLALRDPVVKSIIDEQPHDIDCAVRSIEEAYSRERDNVFYGVPLKIRGYTEADWRNRGKDQPTLDREKAEIQGELSDLLQKTDPSPTEKAKIPILQTRLAESLKPILPHHFAELENAYNNGFFDGQQMTEGDFVLAGINERTGVFEIYKIQFPGSRMDMGYFDVIGPFASRETVHKASRKIINSTLDVESLGGKEISQSEGARIGLSVVREGWAERGIGGQTQLVTIKGNKIIEYTQEQTTYMHNLLELERQGCIGPQKVSETLQKVMDAKEAFEDIVEGTATHLLGRKTEEKGMKFVTNLLKSSIIIGEEFADVL